MRYPIIFSRKSTVMKRLEFHTLVPSNHSWRMFLSNRNRKTFAYVKNKDLWLKATFIDHGGGHFLIKKDKAQEHGN